MTNSNMTKIISSRIIFFLKHNFLNFFKFNNFLLTIKRNLKLEFIGLHFFNSIKLNILKKYNIKLYIISIKSREAGIEPTTIILKTIILPLNYTPLIYFNIFIPYIFLLIYID